MSLLQICLLVLLVVSCGKNAELKTMDISGFQPVQLSVPRLEEISIEKNDRKVLELKSEQLFEVKHLSTYLIEREFYQKFVNTKAALKSSSLNLLTQGLLVRLPLGVQSYFEMDKELKLELFFSSFPYEKQEIFYVWFDVQEQKELSGRRLVLGKRGYLRDIVLEKKIFESVDPANLRLVLIASDTQLKSHIIDRDNNLEQYSFFPPEKVSKAIDLSLKRLPYQPKNNDENFWLCLNCGKVSGSRDIYVETNLSKIYESSRVGEVAYQTTKDNQMIIEGLQFGDEVEISLSSKVQAYELITKSESHRLYLIQNLPDTRMKNSYLCDFSYQDLGYKESLVNFQQTDILERMVISAGAIEMSVASYINHYPERFYSNEKGELILNYLNMSEDTSIRFRFTEEKRVMSIHLSGNLLNTRGRNGCLDALNAGRFKSLKSKVIGRSVKAQDVFHHSLSMKLYGTPRI